MAAPTQHDSIIVYLTHPSTQDEADRRFTAVIAPEWHPLQQIDQYLLACGWTQTPEGWWLAPARFADDLALHTGRGAVRRWVAVAAQVQYHEATLNGHLAALLHEQVG